MTDGDVDLPQPSIGRLLAEVFSVRLDTLDNVDGEGRCKLYGTIKLADSEFWMQAYLNKDKEAEMRPNVIVGRSIYDRKREDYESIKPGEIITLTGPFPCIQAYDSFTFGFYLWNYDNNDEVISGHFTWRAGMDRGDEYDILLSEKVSGLGGSLSLNYAVFSNAVQAFVEVRFVKLINGDGEHPWPAQVYGFLGARNNLIRQEIRLFQISEPIEYLKARPGERMTLSRSVVAASLDSLLTVRAKLFYEYDGDHEIANGRVDFMPELSGTTTKNITGQCGEIEVKVFWVNA